MRRAYGVLMVCYDRIMQISRQGDLLGLIVVAVYLIFPFDLLLGRSRRGKRSVLSGLLGGVLNLSKEA